MHCQDCKFAYNMRGMADDSDNDDFCCQITGAGWRGGRTEACTPVCIIGRDQYINEFTPADLEYLKRRMNINLETSRWGRW